MKSGRIFSLWLWLLGTAAATAAALTIAITGTTGKLGRRAIQLLSSRGIATRCLLRHPINNATDTNLLLPHVAPNDDTASSSAVASYLSQLPHVTMVIGDATNLQSCHDLVQGCDAILALHGPARPPPLQSLFRRLPETHPLHSRSENYVAVQNIITACKASPTCTRIVRVTGKGEQPTQIFTVLINMLGHMAKAWNYEGEQLLRTSGLEYTIVRPGVMRSGNTNNNNNNNDDDMIIPKDGVLALADNGGDLPITPVSYTQIASLCVDCLNYPNTAQSTITVMNVPPGTGEVSYGPLLAKVTKDTRSFPPTLLEQHKKAARIGAIITLCAFLTIISTGLLMLMKTIIVGVGLLVV
jgi:nucleoside-diphosphate-sugar epimerase